MTTPVANRDILSTECVRRTSPSQRCHCAPKQEAQISDSDTRARDWSDLRAESVRKWSRISSTISCGILGIMILSMFTEAADKMWALFLGRLALALSNDGTSAGAET